MRCSFSLGSVAFSGALFALFAVSCGHAISIPDWRTIGAAGSGNAGTGGTPGTSVTLYEELDAGEAGDAGDAGDDNGVYTQDCPAMTMPSEPTLPGYNGISAAQTQAISNLLSTMSATDKYTQMYGVPVSVGPGCKRLRQHRAKSGRDGPL